MRWSPRAFAAWVRLPHARRRVASIRRRLNSETAPWYPNGGGGRGIELMPIHRGNDDATAGTPVSRRKKPAAFGRMHSGPGGVPCGLCSYFLVVGFTPGLSLKNCLFSSM